MPKRFHPTDSARRGLAVPLAATLAVKVIALAILYCAFFVPPSAPGPERATAIFGLR